MPPPKTFVRMASGKRRGSRSGKVSVPNTIWVCAVSRSSARLAPRTAGAGVTPSRGGSRRAALEPPLPLQRGEQLIVVHVSRRGDHAVSPVVAAAVQDLQILGREGDERFRGAEDGVPVGMLRPERLRMQLEHEVVRRVGDPADLLQNHIALGLQVARAQQRPTHQVGEDLDRQRQIGVEHMSLIAGVVAAGEGIQSPAPDLQPQRELLGGPALGAFEDHVLQQMGDSQLAARLMGAGGADVNTHRHRTDSW